MGWYIRKSFSFGPLRLNLSKSGLGASVGVTGARVSLGPRGTYVHMGRYGLYYRERLDTLRRRVSNQLSPAPEGKSDAPPEGEIPTADVSHLTDVTADSILNKANTAAKQTAFWPFAAIATVILATTLYKYPAAAMSILAIGGFTSYVVQTRDTRRRTTPLLYELSEEAERRFSVIDEALAGLSRAQRLWRVVARQSNFDWKQNAGASVLIRRQVATLARCLPKHLATNIRTWRLNLGDQDFFFFPDRVLVQKGSRLGAVSYNDLGIAFTQSRYIEDAWLAPDAQVVDYKWRYVRRDGGADRRYANNRQIPVVLYGLLQFRSTTGLDVRLQVSDQRLAGSFANAFTSAIAGACGTSERPAQEAAAEDSAAVPPHCECPPEVAAAYETLEVTPGTPLCDIERAYRHLAKLYHPDKVNHLAPEFQELAQTRMVELNAAFERIRRYSEQLR